ncbi:MAG: toll/interleukin-1 receptor domain-containing protein [Deltaproteobacteria bacterium]|jgi:hypothetical protein|nr:toll/interleukin-1 receptor domain-containing protein [Deltaproteobacteria bacterium]
MANMMHMDIIKRGVDYWNTWRFNNSHVQPSLSEAGLHMAYLNKANLRRADLSDAGLRLAEMIEANLEGADLYLANLSEANLRRANLKEANLQGTNMAGTNLRGTRLISADLSQANLSRADIRFSVLYRANLYNADLSGADLRNAALNGANLVGANLTGANLDGADLTDAVVGATIFGNVDLSNVKGLESLLHLGPSSIGIDTIYKSKAQMPFLFLKNAGVPQHLIDFIEMFVDRDKRCYSCFISYSDKNREFALKLYEDLQDHGVRCWLTTENLKKRDRIHAVTDAAVKMHDKIILILSEDSIDSDWAENNYTQAIEKEIESGKTVLVPVVLDDSVEKTDQPWAVEMRRSRYAADFSMWRDDVFYKEVLGYLLDELNSDEEPFESGTDFTQEEFPVEEDFSGFSHEIDLNNLAHEFRVERREFL